MTDSQIIKTLTERREALKKELAGVEREIEQLSKVVYRATNLEKQVIDNFSNGKHCIGSYGRHWWVDANGDLIEAVLPEEFDAIKSLLKAGIISRLDTAEI